MADNNISIRTRIRKASTSINPEFGPSIESLLTFVSSSSSQSSSWKKRSDGDSSIVITPLSILNGASSSAGGGGASSGGNGGNAAWRSASPLRSQSAPRGLSSSHRNRSFNRGHPPLLVRAGPNGSSAASMTNSSSVGRRSPVTAGDRKNYGGSIGVAGGRLEMDLSNDSKLEAEEDGMVDISLEDNNKSNHNNNGSSGIMMELETELSSSKDDETREDKLLPPAQSQLQQQQRQRCSTSPLPIVRSGSGLSMPANVGVSGPQDQYRLNNNLSSNNSIGSSNSRALSRSINARSRSINKNMRARSRSRGGGGGGGSDSLTSSGRNRSGRPLSRGGAISLSGRRMRSAGAANAFNTATVVCDDNDSLDHSSHKYHDEEMMITEAMSVLLKDIISVRHETPTSSKNKSAAATAGELYSPHAITRVESFTPPTLPPPSQPLYRPGSKLSTTSQPLSASAHCGMMNSYRIYIHTRMNGYLEFNFDNNSNSYEVVLAYLRCHLRNGMVPPDDNDSVPVGSTSGGVGNATPRGLGQPVNLTRTKSYSNKVTPKDNGGGDDATVTSVSTASISSQHKLESQVPLISRSNSSNPIERLQTKAINRQLQQEHTPMNSMKHNVSGWLSSIVDCASFGCCQDTTVTPEDKAVLYNGNGIQSTPLRKSQSRVQQQQSMTPRSKALKSNGIGGLSFEVETVTSNMSGF